MTLWQQTLTQLETQMTQATFDTWLANTSAQVTNGTLTITVPNDYARAWMEHRLLPTISRTVNRIADQVLEITFEVSNPPTNEQPAAPGPGPQSNSLPDPEAGPCELDKDMPPDCRFGIELVNFDPTTRGFVMTANYAWQFWLPYLAGAERTAGARTGGVAFDLWNTLRSFPASWTAGGRPKWPSIQTLADICANGNRHVLLGREAHGQDKHYRRRRIGAIEILEHQHIVWPKRYGSGRDTIYYFRVLDHLPLLVPAQVLTLTPRLQDRHTREISKCKIDYEEWEQLTLPSLLMSRT